MRRAKLIIPTLLLYTSLLLIRFQLFIDMNLNPGDLFSGFLWLGALYDFVAAGFPAVLALFVSAAFGFSRNRVWPVFAFFVWFAVVANLLHYRFFQSPLFLWTVFLHWSDLVAVRGSAGSLASSLAIIGSVVTFIASVWTALFMRRWAPEYFHAKGRKVRLKDRLNYLGTGFVLIAMLLLVRQSPVWFKWTNPGKLHRDSILASQILTVWWDELFSSRHDDLHVDLKSIAANEPSIQLKAYRDFADDKEGHVMANGDPTPFVHRFSTDPQMTASLRERFGLPMQGPINVVILFLESVRSFEIYHPDIGPAVTPNLRKILMEESISFRQTYSSSLTAGQTVRGQFSTLCSMMPNVLGPATYIAFNTLDIQCLTTLLKTAGYQTLWFNSFRKSFHNKFVFESVHGMQKFYDLQHFGSLPGVKMINGWGIGDEPFLEETLNLIKQHSKEKQPLFAHALTVSTHHPFAMVESSILPEALIEKVGKGSVYHRYLSTINYTDRSVRKFVDGLFASEMGDNTLLVVMADHGHVTRPPHLDLTPVQLAEKDFRIPLAFLSKNLKKPVQNMFPVHQVDIAPTIASIMGVEGTVTWLGKNILDSKVGSPFVYRSENQMFYRTQHRGCYPIEISGERKCFDLNGNKDPMFNVRLTELPENGDETKFFDSVLLATQKAISLNRITPSTITTTSR